MCVLERIKFAQVKRQRNRREVGGETGWIRLWMDRLVC